LASPNEVRPEAETEKRDCAKLIRFSRRELRLVAEHARARRRPVASYIRESSLGSLPRVRSFELSDSLIRVLAQVAGRLTDLATAAKAQGLAGAAEFDTAVVDVLEVIRRID
jgi:hypothetical protein